MTTYIKLVYYLLSNKKTNFIDLFIYNNFYNLLNERPSVISPCKVQVLKRQTHLYKLKLQRVHRHNQIEQSGCDHKNSQISSCLTRRLSSKSQIMQVLKRHQNLRTFNRTAILNCGNGTDHLLHLKKGFGKLQVSRLARCYFYG